MTVCHSSTLPLHHVCCLGWIREVQNRFGCLYIGQGFAAAHHPVIRQIYKQMTCRASPQRDFQSRANTTQNHPLACCIQDCAQLGQRLHSDEDGREDPQLQLLLSNLLRHPDVAL